MSAKVGDVVWYKTGGFTASRARVLEVAGQGATSTYRVEFVDRAPSQPSALDVNPSIGGGVRVAARKCEPIEPEYDDEQHVCKGDGKGQPHCGWFGPQCGYDTIEEEPHAYTLQQIRQGTGFPPNARFRQVSP